MVFSLFKLGVVMQWVKIKRVYEDENDQTLALCTDGVLTHLLDYKNVKLTITEIPKE